MHLGDITKISGYDAPPVEVIIGGSPCQDLSVAGKRAGLDGERSGLFMEQIRLIREMRENDRANGRTDEFIRPRFMVWENVPGAFSSNGGEDFRVVLEETVRVAEPTAVIPRPPKNKWTNAGCIMGNGWSVTWRIFDAQFWGVPQRRRRIALVADFGGNAAPEILFERKSVSGNTESGKEKKETAPADVGCNIEETGAISFQERAGCEGGVKEYSYSTTGQEHYQRSTISECYGISAYGSNAMKSDNPHSGIYKADTARTLDLNGGSPACNQGGMAIVSLLNDQGGASISGDDNAKVAPAIRAEMHGNVPAVVYDARGNGNGCTVPTLTGDHENRITDYTAVCIGNGQADQLGMSEKVGALNYMHDQQAIMTQAVVRRLTPLECERLQGFPDGWTDIGDWTDSKGKKHKAADSPRYKALGNSIALPSWKWVLNRLNRYCREHTMASLFDGIGGFPLIWEQINKKGLCLWASEIEEFPMAVTKIRFGGE